MDGEDYVAESTSLAYENKLSPNDSKNYVGSNSNNQNLPLI